MEQVESAKGFAPAVLISRLPPALAAIFGPSVCTIASNWMPQGATFDVFGSVPEGA